MPMIVYNRLHHAEHHLLSSIHDGQNSVAAVLSSWKGAQNLHDSLLFGARERISRVKENLH
jgi:hypothetical protein